MRLQASHHSFLANAPYIGIHSISYCNISWLNASSPVLQQTFSYVRCIMLRSVHTVIPSCFYRWIVSNFLCWLYKRCISHPVSWFRTVWSVNSYTSERSYPCVYYVQLPFCFTTTAGLSFCVYVWKLLTCTIGKRNPSKWKDILRMPELKFGLALCPTEREERWEGEVHTAMFFQRVLTSMSSIRSISFRYCSDLLLPALTSSVRSKLSFFLLME